MTADASAVAAADSAVSPLGRTHRIPRILRSSGGRLRGISVRGSDDLISSRRQGRLLPSRSTYTDTTSSVDASAQLGSLAEPNSQGQPWSLWPRRQPDPPVIPPASQAKAGSVVAESSMQGTQDYRAKQSRLAAPERPGLSTAGTYAGWTVCSPAHAAVAPAHDRSLPVGPSAGAGDSPRRAAHRSAGSEGDAGRGRR